MMGLGFILLSLFVLNFSLSCRGDYETVTVTVKGLTTIAQTDETFVCANIDWWPSTKCDNSMCPWANSSIVNLDVDNPILTDAIKEFQNLRIRIGGSLQDKVRYLFGGESVTGYCGGFNVSPDELFGYDFGCIDDERWDQVNALFLYTGAMVTFGLNALNGRVAPTDPGDTNYTGPWDMGNAQAFIQLTVANKYPVVGWEFGNQLCGDGVGAMVDPIQYSKDITDLKNFIIQAYSGSDIQPKVSGPSCFFEEEWFTKFLRSTDPGIVDIVSHHVYNLGSGDDPDLVEKMQDPLVLDYVAQIFNNFTLNIQKYSPQSSSWVSESGGAYNNGGIESHGFVDGFWYMDILGRAAAFGHEVFCRHTLVGGNYGLLNATTMLPNPDYYGALLFHRLMGTGVLATIHDGSPYLRAYSHCSRNTPANTLLLINLSNSTTFNINVAIDRNQYAAQNETLPSVGSAQLGERLEYHLTPKYGDIRSHSVLLNSFPLEVNYTTGEIPPLNPVIVDDPNPLIVSPSSIVFVVFNDLEVPACA